MSENDKIQKTMEFLLDRQARAEVEMQQLRDTVNKMAEQAELDRHQAKLDREFMRASIDQMTDAVAELSTDVSKLIDVVENTREFSQNLAQYSDQLAQLVVSSEKRLRLVEDQLRSKD